MSELLTGRQSEGENKFELLQQHFPLVLVYLEGQDGVAEEQITNMGRFIAYERVSLGAAARDAGLRGARSYPALDKVAFEIDERKYNLGATKPHVTKRFFEEEFLQEFRIAAKKAVVIERLPKVVDGKQVDIFVIKGAGKVAGKNVLGNIDRLTQQNSICFPWKNNHVPTGQPGVPPRTEWQQKWGRQAINHTHVSPDFTPWSQNESGQTA